MGRKKGLQPSSNSSIMLQIVYGVTLTVTEMTSRTISDRVLLLL